MFITRMYAASSYRRLSTTTALALSKQGGSIKPREFKKIMVANRGEIAIRVFRACHEMDIKTVAIFAHEDRKSLHLQKADEAYEVGIGKEPVAAYLDIESIINIAKEKDVDAIHPGYGFLSERSDFAEAVINAGIHFIGPAPSVMARMGDKVAARKSAIEAGVKVVPGTDKPVTTAEEAYAFVKEHGCPIILKAAFGGGGRGMRRVDDIAQVKEAFTMASREALANFGNGAMFIERFIETPRHIEVQLMGDHHGNIVHLYERDCSVQRRHQKVVEIAPAPNLDPTVRDKMLSDAIKLANHVGYQNAGTVEFLLDKQGNHYFIEVNARLQVEHTVTEEVTGVDLVQTQIRVAEGKSLPELGLQQDKIAVTRASIQCRLTTEDPGKDFQPDAGRLDVYRTGGGMGIRLDGSAFTGATITPYYDSLLCKIIASAENHELAARKLRRSLVESRIRGVKTNKPFVLNVLRNKDFLQGECDTSFIDVNKDLFKFKLTQNRGMRILNYLAEVSVNGPQTPLATSLKPSRKAPIAPTYADNKKVPKGWKDILTREGPKGFSKAIREHKGLLLTDTTFRDAHQSLLATRVRTKDLLTISPHVAHSMNQLLSLENWGGATFDVCMKFLRECPWDRLASMREIIPNVPFQCLLRGANAVGYKNYSDNVIDEFCRLSVNAGMDIFRIFDCLNYVENMKVGIDAVHKAGGVVEAAIAYTGDVSDTSRKQYNLEYYLDLAEQLSKMDIHILAIKDMAGVLKPRAAKLLIGELRRRYPQLPIVVHTHDTSGVGVASMLAAAESGADAVDCAIDSMSGMTSQPSMGSIVHALKGTELDTGMSTDAMAQYNTYWEQARQLYAPFECTTTMKSGNADVFNHEIPGGQYTNLQFQSYSLNLQDQFQTVTNNYREANLALGDIIKVTPSSKVTGDLAQVMTQQGIKSHQELLEKADDITFPQSVVEFFEGKLGFPPYGFPEELRKKVLRGRKPVDGRPGASMAPMDLKAIKDQLKEKYNIEIDDFAVMSNVMFPTEFDEMIKFREKYGPVDKLSTDEYLCGPEPMKEFKLELEKGKNLLLKFMAIGEPDEKGLREVSFEYNGQYRSVFIKDKEASKGIKSRPKITAGNAGHVGAPMRGNILEVKVKVGDKVEAKQTICVLSAMKMEMAVESKKAGTVTAIEVKTGDTVDADDLIITIE